MAAVLLPYVGAILALVLLWRSGGPRPFWSHRWFVILPISIVGACSGAFVPTYRASASLARIMNDPIDWASLLGETLGAGIASGAIVAAMVIVGNVMRQRDTRT